MNDPLRDNRIFPEEMQQQIKKPEINPKNNSHIWSILGLIALAALLVFGYFWYQGRNNSSTGFTPTQITPEQQAQVITSLKNAAPQQTVQERDELIIELRNRY